MPTLAVISTPASRWTDGRVFGLGDKLAEARVLNRSLADWHGTSELTTGSVTGPGLIVGEDMWVSESLEAAMRAASLESGGVSRLGRSTAGPGRFADPLSRLPRVGEGAEQRILFDVWYVPAGVEVQCPSIGDDSLPSALTDAPLVDIETRTYQIDLPVDPELLGIDELALEAGAAVAVPVSHWAELVRANLLAIGTRILGTSVSTAIFRLFWAALRSLSLNPFKILGALTISGRRCKIHPTAVVEGCTLGDDVEIDAGAVLRGCLIGDGARIGAQAILEFSVVGEKARVYRKAVANLSVVYPDARVGGIVQLGLVGERSASKLYAVGTDMRLGGPVRVMAPDGLRDIDIGYHGVCFGHRSFVGSGVWIAPGRVIEAGTRLVRDRALLVT